MGKRGRKSTAARDLMPRPVEAVERLKPPFDLNDEECVVWMEVVNDQPADWFSASVAPVLAEYCRHVVRARYVAQLLELHMSGFNPADKQSKFSIKDYDRLLKMAVRESACISSLATKLRITNQSVTNHRGNRNRSRPSTNKPWED